MGLEMDIGDGDGDDGGVGRGWLKFLELLVSQKAWARRVLVREMDAFRRWWEGEREVRSEAVEMGLGAEFEALWMGGCLSCCLVRA